MEASQFKSSVDITESFTNGIQNVGDRGRVPQAIAGDHRTRLLNVSALATATSEQKGVYIH